MNCEDYHGIRSVFRLFDSIFSKRWYKIGHLDGNSSINCSYADINLMRISDFSCIGPFHIGNATNIVCCPYFFYLVSHSAYSNTPRISRMDENIQSDGYTQKLDSIHFQSTQFKWFGFTLRTSSYLRSPSPWIQWSSFFPPARDLDKTLEKERFHWRAFWESICLSFTVIATADRKGLEEKRVTAIAAQKR